jgi:hypothetical protein
MIITLYQSYNKELSIIACVTLTNICSNSKHIKNLFCDERNTKYMISKLEAKDQVFLRYHLK